MPTPGASPSAAPHDDAPGPGATRAALARLRPDLLDGYDAALPGARAAVLTRLWGALAREPLPGLTGRHTRGGTLTVTFAAATVSGPAEAALPHAAPTPTLLVTGPPTGRPAEDPAAGTHADDPAAGTHADDPAAVVAALGWPERFAAEVANSVANLALARAAATAPPRLADLERLDPAAALARAEQAVVDGHPLHPCCRTRAGLDTAAVLAYAPEHRPVVRPVLLGVPAERWHGAGPPVLPAHPWQAERLLAAYPWLVRAGTGGPARPLMSLRTLAPADGGPHLKTAVDVQLTSAVRTVSPAAVANGPRLSALLARLAADLPIDVLAETGGAAAPDGRGPDRRLGHLRRQAPPLRPGEVAVPLAAFAAAPGLLTDVVAAHRGDPAAWLRALVALLAPFATLLERGVACEAHGQNTLIVLRGGRPVRVLYRDLGGVRVSPARVRAAGAEAPPIAGDLATDDPDELHTTLAAALVGGSLGEHVAALARACHAEPARLWAVVADGLRGTGLAAAPAPVKATTAMRLAADPLTPVWVRPDGAGVAA